MTQSLFLFLFYFSLSSIYYILISLHFAFCEYFVIPFTFCVDIGLSAKPFVDLTEL